MKRLILFSIVFILCMGLTGLSGCTYSSANLMRAEGDDIMVFGAWGYVHCQNSAVTLYTGRATNSTKKDDYVRLPAMPDIEASKTNAKIENK
jgi:hypothetical protein